LFALDKRHGSLLFSHMVGSARPEDHLDYVRDYHRIDPRTPLLLKCEAGQWMHCHEHFDATRVATDPFYRDFLIHAGGRWASGIKLVEDDDIAVLLFQRVRGLRQSLCVRRVFQMKIFGGLTAEKLLSQRAFA
jgi:hypothetical protein